LEKKGDRITINERNSRKTSTINPLLEKKQGILKSAGDRSTQSMGEGGSQKKQVNEGRGEFHSKPGLVRKAGDQGT